MTLRKLNSKAKHTSLNLLVEDEEVNGEADQKKNNISANYHSLTMNSYGVLVIPEQED